MVLSRQTRARSRLPALFATWVPVCPGLVARLPSVASCERDPPTRGDRATPEACEPGPAPGDDRVPSAKGPNAEESYSEREPSLESCRSNAPSGFSRRKTRETPAGISRISSGHYLVVYRSKYGYSLYVTLACLVRRDPHHSSARTSRSHNPRPVLDRSSQ